MDPNLLKNIIQKTGYPEILGSLSEKLTLPELQSLLLKIYELKTAKLTVNDIFHSYKTSRYLKPSEIEPAIYKKLDLKIFTLLPEGFKTIELSPLAPLGSSSVLATVHQNNVVSTIRNNQVTPDSTNVLAIESALRREAFLHVDKKSAKKVKLCSSQRLTRSQAFENKNFSAHFALLAMCTAGRDTGSNSFETETYTEHILFYLKALNEIIAENQVKKVTIKLYDYNEADNSKIYQALFDSVKTNGIINFKKFENSAFGKGFYRRLRFMISVTNHKDEEFDYIDGGMNDWTAKLLNSAKERVLTSAIGIDYLLRTVKCNIDN